MKRILVSVLVGGLLFLAGPVQAGSGSCSVSPNPVSVNQSYIVSAQGLPASSPVNVFVTESGSTNFGQTLQSGADGTLSFDGASWSTGTTIFTLTGPTKGHQPPVWGSGTKVYTSCSVEVT
jgi:hypothetical protein